MKDLLKSVNDAAASFQAAQAAIATAPCKSNVASLAAAHTSLVDAVKSLSDALNLCSNEPTK